MKWRRWSTNDTDAEIYVGLEHLDPDSLKLRRWGAPSDVIGDKLRFRKGDIIFGRRRAYQRKLAVAEFDGICSAHAMVVRAKNETVDSEFLPFFMQSDLFMQRAIDISVGSLSPTIKWTALRIQEFPLPPKDEQRRIADILWAADDACEGVQSSLKEILQFREVYTEAALENRLEDDNSGSNKHNPSWPLEYLAEHVDLASGQVDPREEPYCDMVLVAPNHIEPGTGRLLERVTAKQQHAISGKYEFAAGDVIYSKIRPNLKKVILADAPGLCSADMYPMRAKASLNARYLLMLLLGQQFSAFAESESVRTGIPKLNRQSFSSYRCLLPPLQEQDQIIERIGEIDHGVFLVRAHLERLLLLKRELMASLLFGGHDVH
jgi:restriction endonuclease S subunit